MKVTYLLLIALALFAIPLVSADDIVTQHLPAIQQGTCGSLPQQCSNCTYSNITSIRYPNGTEVIQQLAMTKSGLYFNYTFCNTQTLGTYIVAGKTDQDGGTPPWSYDFPVTTYGGNGNSFLVAIFLILFAIVMLMIAFWAGNELVGFIAGCLFIVSGVYTMIYGLGDVADDYTRMIAVVLIGIGLMFDIAVGYQLTNSSEEEN